jgi:hypothetical protein
MLPRTPLALGLVLGGLLGFAYLLHPITLFPSLLVWVWLLNKRPRPLAIAGGLIGFGAVWIVLIGRASWACAQDATCAQPNILPFWFAIGAVFCLAGLLLLLAGRRHIAER